MITKKKIPAARKFPTPPPPPTVTFLMVRPLDILIHDREYTLQLGINLTMNTKIAQLNKIPNAANCTSPRVP